MNRQSNKITAAYCRLARYDKNMDGDTARKQMELLLRYTEERGLVNTELFCDWGFSGLDNERPQYQRMVRAVEAGTVSDLIVQDLSRLWRDAQMCSMFIENFLPRHGVTFHSVKDGLIYTLQALNELAAQCGTVCALLQHIRRERGRQ